MPPRAPKQQPKQKKRDEGAVPPAPSLSSDPELILVTGLSGSGKGTVIRALEDLGYYSVDNLPLDLME